MNVLVTGDRHWDDRQHLFAELDRVHDATPITLIIEGCARGADSLAVAWAQEHCVHVAHMAADWEQFGKAAGPIRNKAMLDLGPDLVIAFHDNLPLSKGTRNMVEQAKKAGATIIYSRHEGET